MTWVVNFRLPFVPGTRPEVPPLLAQQPENPYVRAARPAEGLGLERRVRPVVWASFRGVQGRIEDPRPVHGQERQAQVHPLGVKRAESLHSPGLGGLATSLRGACPLRDNSAYGHRVLLPDR